MRTISFGWTWPAFVAREKWCTRRDWKPRHVEAFRKAFRDRELVEGLDKVFFAGGKRIGTLRLTHEPYQENLREMPLADYKHEGFAYMREHMDMVPKAAQKQPWYPCTLQAFKMWRAVGKDLWVVRFEPVEIYKKPR